jgi:hypothetical protein
MIKRALYVLCNWECWDYRVKYIPLYPAWLWYCLRSGSFWFFTASNPTITFGGFEGEGKKEMYDQLPTSSYPKSIYISPTLSFDNANADVVKNKFTYPFAVKPDVGMMGFLFRKIDNVEDFKRYHAIMPADYIVQELVTFPMDVSVFYYRYPNENKGHITGFVKKELLEVVGDGKTNLGELISQLQLRAGFNTAEWLKKHAQNLNEVIPLNEKFRLSWTANLSRGSKLVNIEYEKDERLLKVFDELSHYAKHFYYGRYDIKCTSIEDLKAGKNFSILEYNGSGAEPHHAYGNGNTLLQAHSIFLHHWKVLYKISNYNNRQGIAYWKFKDGLRFIKASQKHFKLLRKLDKLLPV